MLLVPLIVCVAMWLLPISCVPILTMLSAMGFSPELSWYQCYLLKSPELWNNKTPLLQGSQLQIFYYRDRKCVNVITKICYRFYVFFYNFSLCCIVNSTPIYYCLHSSVWIVWFCKFILSNRASIITYWLWACMFTWYLRTWFQEERNMYKH